MDSFEQVVASVLQRQGYWTQTSVKVDLSKAEKVRIGRHSSPRWELDVVAYRGLTNELLVVECKSFLDSRGVSTKVFADGNPNSDKRYKLFTEPVLRRTVLACLRRQYVAQGFCARRPSVKLGLAAGRVYGDEARLKAAFRRRGWLYWGPQDLKRQISALRDSHYENSVAAVVAKMLLRGPELQD